MAEREDFRLETGIRFERDNPAVDAILLVIEDAFGRGVVSRSTAEEDGSARATIRLQAPGMDARRVNWLHGQLATLAKYLLEPADVDCADAGGRERCYRLDPAAPAAAAPGTGATVDGADNAEAPADEGTEALATGDDEAGGADDDAARAD